jgi:hypothetical protein
MEIQVGRRRVLFDLTSAAIAITVAGCGRDEGAPAGSSAIVFRDTEEFYTLLNAALATDSQVSISFDGSEKVKKESRLLTEFMAKASNAQEFYETIIKRDTLEGRTQLSRAFEDKLLEHEPATSGLETPNGEIIDPGTVILILGIAFIIAAASVAHAESMRGRSYHIELRAGPDSVTLVFASQ